MATTDTSDDKAGKAPETAPLEAIAVPEVSKGAGAARNWIGKSLVLVLAVAAGVFGVLWWQAESADRLRTDALDSAREYAITLGTYNFESFDESLAAVTEISTDKFAEKYNAVAGELRSLVENGQGSSVARADHAAVESVDGDRATVLVFLDQDVKNVAVPDGRTDATRFLITLVRDGDRWLLDGADAK
jgi:Mce-associated membrane protein